MWENIPMKNREKLKIDIPNLLMFAFLLMVLVRRIFPIPGLIGNACLALLGCLNFAYVFLKRYREKYVWKIILLGAVLSGCMLASYFYNHNADFLEILWIWCFMGAGVMLACFDIDYRWCDIVFWLAAAYFTVSMIMGRNVNAIIFTSSRNEISALLIFFMSFLYLTRKKDRELPYLPAVLSVVLAAWALGRAGLLATSFFLVIIVLYDLLICKNRNPKKIACNLVVLAVLLLGLLKLYPTYDGDVPEQQEIQEELQADDNKQGSGGTHRTIVTKLEGQGFTSPRTRLWKEYMEEMLSSGKELVFGVTYDHGEILSKYQNTHNMFLELHSKYGLAGFLIVGVLMLLTFVKQCRRKDILAIVILMGICIRGFFDWIAFPGAFDALFYFFIFDNLFVMRFDNEKAECCC